MVKLSYRTVGKILQKKERRMLVAYSFFRVFANLLDLLGISLVAVLATGLGQLTSYQENGPSVSLPILGSFVLTQSLALSISLGVLILFIARSGFSIWLNLVSAIYIGKIESRLSTLLVCNFFTMKNKNTAEQYSISEFQNLAMASTAGVKNLLNSRVVFIAEGTLLLGVVGLLIFVNPLATLALSLFLGTVLLILNGFLSTALQKNGERQMSGSRTSLQALRDLYGIQKEALIGGVEEEWISRFTTGRARMASSSAINLNLTSLPRYIIETSLVLSIFAFIGGVVVFSDIPSQAATIGAFMAGGLRIMASLLPFQSAISGMKSGAATGKFAFDELLSKPEEIQEIRTKEESSAGEGKLSFHNVFFAYPEATRSVINNVSFDIEPRTKVALVGPSGAGKSTIFDLCLGFIEPNSGKVRYGNISAREALLLKTQTFSLVPQRPHLVSGTLLENISLRATKDSDSEKVKELLELVGLEKLTLETNWSSRSISPDNGSLSGGEIQRLSLARALYRDPRILFLDEATSALDAETELEITEVLNRVKERATIVMIAHRLSTVKRADTIIYLDEGKIKGQGSFTHLKKNLPEFARAVEILKMEQ